MLMPPEFTVCIVLSILIGVNCSVEEEHGVVYANRCEACKILAIELEERLQETGKSHDVIEVGYSVDDVKPKKRKEYKKSELRLIESLENICDRVLDYNVHKERKGSTRFAKGMSQTFRTLHNLVAKGVKVDLGMPYEIWDSPSAEVSRLKTQCETLIEQHEGDVEDWYYNEESKGIPLIKYLCEDIILSDEDSSCLYETITGDEDEDDEEYQKGSKTEL